MLFYPGKAQTFLRLGDSQDAAGTSSSRLYFIFPTHFLAPNLRDSRSHGFSVPKTSGLLSETSSTLRIFFPYEDLVKTATVSFPGVSSRPLHSPLVTNSAHFSPRSPCPPSLDSRKKPDWTPLEFLPRSTAIILLSWSRVYARLLPLYSCRMDVRNYD